MFVTTYMTKKPVTIFPDTLIPKAKEILRERGFRHLPVTDQQGVLLGMVTDRDIRSAFPSSILEEQERKRILGRVANSTVESIMSTSLSSLSLRSTIDDALILLEKQNIGALPVLDDSNKVIGIFSIRDLMRAYGDLFGLYEKGSVLVSIKEEGQDTINRILRTLEKNDIPIIRLVRATQPTEDKKETQVIYIRVQTMNLPSIKNAMKEAGLTLL